MQACTSSCNLHEMLQVARACVPICLVNHSWLKYIDHLVRLVARLFRTQFVVYAVFSMLRPLHIRRLLQQAVTHQLSQLRIKDKRILKCDT